MIGERLKKLRKEKGLEAQYIAKQLNVAKSTYSGYENNKSTPNYEILSKLADLLNTTTDYLIGRTESEELAIIEGDEIPKELQEVGIEYLKVNKELKEKGLSPQQILDLINSLEKAGILKNNNQ